MVDIELKNEDGKIVGYDSNGNKIPIRFGETEHDSVTTEVSHTKQDPVVNVKAWGAKGDGSTNDTQAIRDALSYLKEEGGGRLFFPAGTYVVCENSGPEKTFDLTDKPNLEICGVGYASHIKAKDGVAEGVDAGVVIFHGGENADIHDLRVDGRRSTQGKLSGSSDGGNFVQLGANSTLHNVWSVNSTGDGVETVGDGVSVSDCLFRNNEKRDIHIRGSNTSVNDNLCENCQEGFAIKVGTATTEKGNISTVEITDNVIDNPVTGGISIGQKSAWATDATIVSNRIVDSGGHGIRSETAAKGLEIAGNTVVKSAKDGIHVTVTERSAADCIRPQVTNNTVRDSGNSGIAVSNLTQERVSAAVASPRIKDNDVFGAGQAACRVSNTDDPRIDSNTFEGSQKQGLHVTSSVTLSRVRIRDNDIIDNNQADSSFDGIRTYADNASISALVIRGNEIDSVGEPQHQRGISIWDGAGSYSSVHLRDNTVMNQTEVAYGISESDWYSVVRGNYPSEVVDVRSLTEYEGNKAYHDGSGEMPSGPAFYDVYEKKWTSLVDGTTSI
ncbi:glycosyl transferase [Halogeometricum borinquense DSM 11551]|uniref:Glycosyl transferase n=1 Tax=Halogeometricum borinquense (strain ATCC 700274 / DSM 11551 / JCM 10706 / KCTC 4070 / PR3) TaxID=469382 RepID=E4NVR5_HALBP|nr:right-handed parallel beta-helix repeat-containing protein [Halogeometricum borinquense]ADQ69135.1 glycosyl transferase [Halogeometricum borinquense DSM 11551]ELY31807.1 glycosyl transferase [Halogeometricum borinquense DSM 11551]